MYAFFRISMPLMIEQRSISFFFFYTGALCNFSYSRMYSKFLNMRLFSLIFRVCPKNVLYEISQFLMEGLFYLVVRKSRRRVGVKPHLLQIFSFICFTIFTIPSCTRLANLHINTFSSLNILFSYFMNLQIITKNMFKYSLN